MIKSYMDFIRPKLLKPIQVAPANDRRPRRNAPKEGDESNVLFLNSLGKAWESDEIGKLVQSQWIGKKQFSFNHLRKSGHTDFDEKEGFDVFCSGAQHTYVSFM